MVKTVAWIAAALVLSAIQGIAGQSNVLIGTPSGDSISTGLSFRSGALQIAHITFNLGPCGVRYPHYHPDADELLVVVKGTVTAAVVYGNGTTTESTIGGGVAFEFPRGPAHYYYNPTCKTTKLITALNKSPFTTYLIDYIPPGYDELVKKTLYKYSGKLRTPRPVGTFAYRRGCLRKCKVTGFNSTLLFP